MNTRIYGASDDLIEIEGNINDEHDCYDHKRPIKITGSDGTIANIFYNGEWKIKVKKIGTKYMHRIDNVGEDGKHIGIANGVPSYSDVLVFSEGLEWVKVGSKTYKKD